MGSKSSTTVTLGASTLSLAHLVSSSQFSIDSDTLRALSSSSVACLKKIEKSDADPVFLSSNQSRAALVVLLNKFLLARNEIRPTLPLLILQTLNQGFDSTTLDWGSVSRFLDSFLRLNGKNIEDIGVTNGELFVLENSSAQFIAIRGLLVYTASLICKEADLVAALSCEATRADISTALHVESPSRPPKFSTKVNLEVSNDLKVLMMGSRLVGDVQSDAFSNIIKFHGFVRSTLRLALSRSYCELNSPVVVQKFHQNHRQFQVKWDREVWWPQFPIMTSCVLPMAENSLQRSKLICDAINDPGLLQMFERNHGNFESLRDAYSMVVTGVSKGDYFGFLSDTSRIVSEGVYFGFLNETSQMLVHVRTIIAWEGALALLFLERINCATDIMGKGTSVLRQLMMDGFQNEDLEPVELLDRLTQHILSFFDRKAFDPDAFLIKVKDIVQGIDQARGLHCDPTLGSRDFDEELIAWRQTTISTITKVYEKHGATRLHTTTSKLSTTLIRNCGEDSKLIHDPVDQGFDLCPLRYNLPIQFARYIASNNVTSAKKYLIHSVFGRDNPFEEHCQIDFDIAGNATMEVMGPDCEVLQILMAVLAKLNIVDYEIKLNHLKLLDGMLGICGIPAEKFRIICASIDKLDQKSVAQIKKEMVGKGMTVEIADRIGTFVNKSGPPLQILSELRQEGREFVDNREFVLALKDLEILFNHLEKNNCLHRVVFDLSLTFGLHYYTGVVFEVALKGAKQVGSIAAGGRYDNLIKEFGPNQVPAVGVTLHVKQIFTFMEQQLAELHSQANKKTVAEALTSILGEDSYINSKLKEYLLVQRR